MQDTKKFNCTLNQFQKYETAVKLLYRSYLSLYLPELGAGGTYIIKARVEITYYTERAAHIARTRGTIAVSSKLDLITSSIFNFKIKVP